MKFVQLKDYDRKIFFLGNHTQNVVEKPFPGSIIKKNQNGEYLWIIRVKFYTVCFYCMPNKKTKKTKRKQKEV